MYIYIRTVQTRSSSLLQLLSTSVQLLVAAVSKTRAAAPTPFYHRHPRSPVHPLNPRLHPLRCKRAHLRYVVTDLWAESLEVVASRG